MTMTLNAINQVYGVFATAFNGFLGKMLGTHLTLATIVTSLFDALAEIVEGIGTLFASAGSAVVSVIYDSTASEITVIGTLVLIGAGVGLFFFVLKWVLSLIKIKGN